MNEGFVEEKGIKEWRSIEKGPAENGIGSYGRDN